MATTGILDVQYTKRTKASVVITEDSDGLGAFCHCFQLVAEESDVCLIMGNDTVQHVDELDVVWKHRMLLSRFLFLEL